MSFFSSIRTVALAAAAPSRQAARRFATRSAARPSMPQVRTALPSVRGVQARGFKSEAETKSQLRFGPFSWQAGVLCLVTLGGLMVYFENEKKRMHQKRVADANKQIGRPKIGGPFELLDQNGKLFSSEDLKGRYSLVYFGFTHCPDICPEELDKMAQLLDLVEADKPGAVVPLFITCDPARDGPEELKSYLAEFHKNMVGLTGTYEQIKAVCKSYRVYFSTPSNVKPGDDYLVDHSIYFYLMDPDGDFVEALGRQHSPQDAASVILGHVRDWTGAKKF